MYIVREIFHLHFGKYREAKALFDEGVKDGLISQPEGCRLLTDFTGEGYRFIMELPFKNLEEYEAELNSELGGDRWRSWYERFKPLVRFSEREILKQVK